METNRRRPGIARKTIAWALAISVVAGVTSCSRMVDGHALAAQAKVGAPIEWKACQTDESDTVQTPPDAKCGKLAVPVDYNDRDGDSATLALIRIPAKGAKIGSLIVNPGGPGESG